MPGSRRRRKRHNLSPQGDGNSLLIILLFLGLDTTYPRKGTETQGGKSNPEEGGHNLSPQGDGNLGDGIVDAIVFGHNLSPQGDGNLFSSEAINSAYGHNLSPQGDGNRYSSVAFIPAADVTDPRKGVESGLGFWL